MMANMSVVLAVDLCASFQEYFQALNTFFHDSELERGVAACTPVIYPRPFCKKQCCQIHIVIQGCSLEGAERTACRSGTATVWIFARFNQQPYNVDMSTRRS